MHYTTQWQHDRFLRLLDAKGWGAGELAEHANISKAYAYRLISRERIPGSSVVGSLAVALGVSLDYLWGLTDIPNSNKLPVVEEFQELLVMQEKLLPPQRHSLILLARAYAAETQEAENVRAMWLLWEMVGGMVDKLSLVEIVRRLEDARRQVVQDKA